MSDLDLGWTDAVRAGPMSSTSFEWTRIPPRIERRSKLQTGANSSTHRSSEPVKRVAIVLLLVGSLSTQSRNHGILARLRALCYLFFARLVLF